jgi:dTDP-4-dehydrorhamnose reductase
MNILLTGKNGQVGFELERSLAALGEVTAVDVDECNLADESAIRALVSSRKPDVIVNPAAYTAVDAAEKTSDLAHAINGRAPGIFGELAAQLGALVVHFSTDYVFDGSKDGRYTEADATGPLGVYGASKLAGEIALAASGAHHVILRTSWVVGAHGNNFAKTMLRLAKERDSLKVVADQFGAPTTAALLADVTAHIVRNRDHAGKNSGVYHVACSGETNWHQYARFVIDFAQKSGVALKAGPDDVHAIPSSEYPTPAKRPSNSRLDTSKFRTTFGLHLPSWQQCLTHTLRQIVTP